MKKSWLTVMVIAITVVLCWGAAELTYAILRVDIERQVTRSEDINQLNSVSQKKIRFMIDGTGPYQDYHQIDPDLGWSIRKNGKSELYSANNIGIRGTKDHVLQKPASIKTRIASFGDSFTHGDDVANEHTWQHYMESKNPSIEVMNFGVGGYGTDQAFLRYKFLGEKYKPDIVLIGFMVENINRNANYFVPFYRRLSSPASKPRFSLDKKKQLVLHENPLKSRADYIALRDHPADNLRNLGQHDYFYRRVLQNKYDSNILRLIKYIYINISDPWVLDHNRQYNIRSEPYLVTVAIMQKFYREARNAGAVPLIVIFPETEDVVIAVKNSPKRHQPLLDELEQKQLEYIDIVEGFKQRDILSLSRLFKGHYTPFGNESVAKILLTAIEPHL